MKETQSYLNGLNKKRGLWKKAANCKKPSSNFSRGKQILIPYDGRLLSVLVLVPGVWSVWGRCGLGLSGRILTTCMVKCSTKRSFYVSILSLRLI